ncbi:MAG: potassium-transporting ATPase subunit KdpA [Caldilineaceae bacterium]
MGNFWADLVRGTLYILFPLSLGLAVLLVSQGVLQNWQPYVEVRTLTGASQLLPQGPAASQIAIKQTRRQRRRLLQHQQHPSL